MSVIHRSPGAGWAGRRAGGRGEAWEPSHSARSAKTCPPSLSWAVTPHRLTAVTRRIPADSGGRLPGPPYLWHGVRVHLHRQWKALCVESETCMKETKLIKYKMPTKNWKKTT